MNFQTRKKKIIDRLNQEGEVDIKTLAAELQVSEITARRDVNQMAADGMLYRTHGGAVKVNPVDKPFSFENKAAQNWVVKDAICRKAATQIQDGDIVRNIRDNIRWIGHFHTGGNPGRHDIDETQELNYRFIAQAIADLNFTGFLSHEYSPSPGHDPIATLNKAIEICDV